MALEEASLLPWAELQCEKIRSGLCQMTADTDIAVLLCVALILLSMLQRIDPHSVEHASCLRPPGVRDTEVGMQHV